MYKERSKTNKETCTHIYRMLYRSHNIYKCCGGKDWSITDVKSNGPGFDPS